MPKHMPVLKKLLEGNLRYINGQSINKTFNPDVFESHVAEQKPIAIVIGCSDSRVIPEYIFDANIGELFVLRIAGNVINSDMLGSIEYAIEVLGARLIIVLGHSYCGAVDATSDDMADYKPALSGLINRIKVGIDEHNFECPFKANIGAQVKTLSLAENSFTKLIEDNTVKLVGAFYDMHSGQVTFI